MKVKGGHIPHLLDESALLSLLPAVANKANLSPAEVDVAAGAARARALHAALRIEGNDFCFFHQWQLFLT